MNVNIDPNALSNMLGGVATPEQAANQKRGILDKFGDAIDTLGGLNSKIKKAGFFNESTPNVATTPTGDVVLYEQGKTAPIKASGFDNLLTSFGKILETGAQQAGSVVAAREVNKDLNKNPPYNLYAIAVVVLAGMYIVLNRK